MRVLQFAFGGGPTNPYLPHNYLPDTVVYTGTHDNDTTLAWFKAQSAETQHYVRDYLGHPGEAMPWPLLRAALASVARLAILPLQDVLALGQGERMNTPGTGTGNWGWRFGWDQVQPEIAPRLRHLIVQYGREAKEQA
jgi:4-alpha-glucanotransferase